MDAFEKAERKRIAQGHLRAQRLRAGELRSRVVAISLICFALLWGVVFVQMATGNDPVLGQATARGAHPASRPRSSGASSPPQVESGPAEAEALEPEFEEPEVEEVEEVEPEVEPVAPEPEPEPVITGQS
jgi:hypothetical protein